MRRQLVTVRWPGASNAPINSTCACRQTRPENNGAKVFRRATNSGGKDSKQDHFLGHLHTTAPSRNGQSRAYDTDLTDAEWEQLVPLVPAVQPGGRPPKHSRREIL